jgi:hypothetical protein
MSRSWWRWPFALETRSSSQMDALIQAALGERRRRDPIQRLRLGVIHDASFASRKRRSRAYVRTSNASRRIVSLPAAWTSSFVSRSTSALRTSGSRNPTSRVLAPRSGRTAVSPSRPCTRQGFAPSRYRTCSRSSFPLVRRRSSSTCCVASGSVPRRALARRPPRRRTRCGRGTGPEALLLQLHEEQRERSVEDGLEVAGRVGVAHRDAGRECVRVRPTRSEEACSSAAAAPESVKRKNVSRHQRRNEWAAESMASCRCLDIEVSPQTTPDLSALSSSDALATWQALEERTHVGELEDATPANMNARATSLVEDLESKPFELKSAPARRPSIETAARAPEYNDDFKIRRADRDATLVGRENLS